jgi:SAM-dependent methyltransferase
MGVKMPRFLDYFSNFASTYKKYRPTYPRAIFKFLAKSSPSTSLAWDCGTGNGQAAIALADFFTQIHATDLSAAQIVQATKHPRIRYSNEPAESCSLPSLVADAIVVASAYHWFDAERFQSEVMRVLVPGGLLCTMAYGTTKISPRLDAAVDNIRKEILEPYWPPEAKDPSRRHPPETENLKHLPTDAYTIECDWRLDDLLGYVSTWSAFQLAIQNSDTMAIEHCYSQLTNAWGKEDFKTVAWDIDLQVLRRIPF